MLGRWENVKQTFWVNGYPVYSFLCAMMANCENEIDPRTLNDRVQYMLEYKLFKWIIK